MTTATAPAAVGHSASHAEPHGFPWKYVIVWGLLLLGTGLTNFVAHGERTAWTLPIAMLIATTKASLVAMIFMHLWNDRGLPKLILLTVLVFLGLLIGLVITDLHNRFPLVTPRGEVVAVPTR